MSEPKPEVVTLALAKKYTNSVALNGVPVQTPQIDPITSNWLLFNPTTNSWIDTGVTARGKSPRINANGVWEVWSDSAQDWFNTGIRLVPMTEDVEVTDPTTESLSGTADTQAEINQEFKEALEAIDIDDNEPRYENFNGNNPLVIPNTRVAPIHGIAMRGNSTLDGNLGDTAIGKNQFNVDVVLNAINNSAYVREEQVDGRNALTIISNSAILNKPFTFGFKPLTQYTFSFETKSVANYVRGGIFVVFYTDGSYTHSWSAGLAGVWTPIIMTTDPGKSIDRLQLSWGDGPEQYYDLDTFQIEEGITATAFEPFVAGFNLIIRGKNWTNTKPLTALGNPALEALDDNSFVFDLSKGTTAGLQNLYLFDVSELLSNQQYTVSIRFEELRNFRGPRLIAWYEDGTYDSGSFSESPIGTGSVMHIDTSKKITKMGVTFGAQAAGLSYWKAVDLQCELGNTVTAFEQYVEPTIYPVPAGPLRGVSESYSDRVWFDLYNYIGTVWNPVSRVQRRVDENLNPITTSNVDITLPEPTPPSLSPTTIIYTDDPIGWSSIKADVLAVTKPFVEMETDPVWSADKPGVMEQLDEIGLKLGVPGTYTQGIDFDAAGKPSFQDWLDANVRGRRFSDNLTIQVDPLGPTFDVTIANVLMDYKSVNIRYLPYLGPKQSTGTNNKIFRIFDVSGGSLNIISDNQDIFAGTYYIYSVRTVLQGQLLLHTLQMTYNGTAQVQAGATIEIANILRGYNATAITILNGSKVTMSYPDRVRIEGRLVIEPTATLINFSLASDSTGIVIDDRPGNPLDTFARVGSSKIMPDGSDFNALITPGTYRGNSMNSWLTMLNRPDAEYNTTTGYWYNCQVNLTSEGIIVQRIEMVRPDDPNVIYERASQDSIGTVWDSWDIGVMRPYFETRMLRVRDSRISPPVIQTANIADLNLGATVSAVDLVGGYDLPQGGSGAIGQTQHLILKGLTNNVQIDIWQYIEQALITRLYRQSDGQPNKILIATKTVTPGTVWQGTTVLTMFAMVGEQFATVVQNDWYQSTDTLATTGQFEYLQAGKQLEGLADIDKAVVRDLTVPIGSKSFAETKPEGDNSNSFASTAYVDRAVENSGGGGGGVGGTDTYSTTEQLTNKVWIDGKPIYRKITQWTAVAVAVGAVPSLGAYSNFCPGADKITDGKLIWQTNQSSGSAAGVSYPALYISGTNFILRNDTSAAIAAGFVYYILLEYTKV